MDVQGACVEADRSSNSFRHQLDSNKNTNQQFGVVIRATGEGKLPGTDKPVSWTFMEVILVSFGGNEALF